MKRILLCALSLLMDSVGYAEDISIRYNGSSAKVKQTATDSVKVTVDGARVSIESLYKDHKLTLNDAHVIARSTGNDAVDSNPEGGFFMPFGGNNQDMDPAIVIRGGTVYAWSQVGSPEEGIDCDSCSFCYRTPDRSPFLYDLVSNQLPRY